MNVKVLAARWLVIPVLGLGSMGAIFVDANPAAAIEAPGCTAVTPAAVRATIGKSATFPVDQSGSFGEKSSSTLCTAGTLNVSFSFPATLTTFNTQFQFVKSSNPSAVKVVGVGAQAFSAIARDGAAQQPLLAVLVLANKKNIATLIEVSDTKATIAEEKAFVLRILPTI